MNRVFFVLTLLLSLQASASNLEEYLQSAIDHCPSAKVLALKKSMIEISGPVGCAGPFTQIVLRDCPGLSCEELTASFYKVFKKEQGRVIGR